jgi:hypothetical protein
MSAAIAPSVPAATSPTFQLDFVPGRFAVVVYECDRIVAIDREFLTWNDARGRSHHLTTVHIGSDRWAAAVPQPVVRATFESAAL